jgi:hypothetical protein
MPIVVVTSASAGETWIATSSFVPRVIVPQPASKKAAAVDSSVFIQSPPLCFCFSIRSIKAFFEDGDGAA